MFRAIDRLARYKSGHDGYLRSPDGAVPIGGPAKAGSSGPLQPRKQGGSRCRTVIAARTDSLEQ